MTNLFDDIKETVEGRDLSLRWYQARIRALGGRQMQGPAAGLKMIREGKDRGRISNRPTYGMLNLFRYFPEEPTTMPYYDIFPLVLPLRRKRDGFVGINFHFLPLPLRVKVLNRLMESFGDEAAEKLDVAYGMLKANRFIRPALRRYKREAVASYYLQVPLEDMLIGILLPVARFFKGPYEKRQVVHPNAVWRRTRRLVNA